MHSTTTGSFSVSSVTLAPLATTVPEKISCFSAHLAGQMAPANHSNPFCSLSFSVIPVSNLTPGLFMRVINARGRLIDDDVVLLHPMFRPIDVLKTRKCLIKHILIPEITANGGIRVIRKEIRRPENFSF